MGFTKFYDSAVVGGAQEDKEEEAVIRQSYYPPDFLSVAILTSVLYSLRNNPSSSVTDE